MQPPSLTITIQKSADDDVSTLDIAMNDQQLVRFCDLAHATKEADFLTKLKRKFEQRKETWIYTNDQEAYISFFSQLASAYPRMELHIHDDKSHVKARIASVSDAEQNAILNLISPDLITLTTQKIGRVQKLPEVPATDFHQEVVHEPSLRAGEILGKSLSENGSKNRNGKVDQNLFDPPKSLRCNRVAVGLALVAFVLGGMEWHAYYNQ